MTLIEKVQELQAIKPPLDPTEMNRRIAEWKKQTGYKAPEAIKVEEVKTEVVAEKDATAATTPVASESSSSGSGQSQYQEGDFNKLHKNVFGK